MEWFPLSVSVCISEILLVVVCLLADRWSYLLESGTWPAAVHDNVVHGLIAFLSWAVCMDCGLKRQDLLQCSACAFLAMALDVDHFLVAKSFTLKKVISQPGRPPFHNTTVVPIVAVLVLLTGRLFSWKLANTVALLFTVSWLSHHLRDATRRGLWIWPLGHSHPLSVWTCTLLTATLPLVLKLLSYLCESRTGVVTENTVQDSTV